MFFFGVGSLHYCIKVRLLQNVDYTVSVLVTASVFDIAQGKGKKKKKEYNFLFKSVIKSSNYCLNKLLLKTQVLPISKALISKVH